MNSILWILQVLLALHTIMGAVWKFSNTEQMASLNMIPHGVWMTMGIVELLCSAGLILAALNKSLGKLVPVAAVCIGAEMLIFCALSLSSGAANYSHMIYWLVVAAVCAFIAYGRFAVKPIQRK